MGFLTLAQQKSQNNEQPKTFFLAEVYFKVKSRKPVTTHLCGVTSDPVFIKELSSFPPEQLFFFEEQHQKSHYVRYSIIPVVCSQLFNEGIECQKMDVFFTCMSLQQTTSPRKQDVNMKKRHFFRQIAMLKGLCIHFVQIVQCPVGKLMDELQPACHLFAKKKSRLLTHPLNTQTSKVQFVTLEKNR